MQTSFEDHHFLFDTTFINDFISTLTDLFNSVFIEMKSHSFDFHESLFSKITQHTIQQSFKISIHSDLKQFSDFLQASLKTLKHFEKTQSQNAEVLEMIQQSANTSFRCVQKRAISVHIALNSAIS